MRFDVVIGNPPYQQESNMDKDKFNTLKTEPLYDKFINIFIGGPLCITRYLSLVIPARWYNSSNSNLNKMKVTLLNNGRVMQLVDFPDARSVFNGVRIAGGLCYFNWCSEYSGECKVINNGIVCSRNFDTDIVIRDNVAYNIINKIYLVNGNRQINPDAYIDSVIARSIFTVKESSKNNIGAETFKVKTSYGWEDIDKSNVIINEDIEHIIQKNKFIIGKLLAGGGDHPRDKEGRMKVISGMYRLGKDEIFGSSFLFIWADESEEVIKNVEKYIKTKFVRFLIYSTLTGLNIGPINFGYVPVQDFTISWTDEMLYEKYNINTSEADYIASVIKEI